MKSYTQHNFFKHTYCEFTQCNETVFNKKTIHYTSKKGSKYSYTDDGVYRYANHWGRVANCRWKIEQTEKYKNQQFVVGFAKWADFYPLNETEKLFYISVDFDLQQVTINHIKNDNKKGVCLFSTLEVAKRKKQIQQLLTTTYWTKYYTQPIEILRKSIVSELISSDKTFQVVKKEQK